MGPKIGAGLCLVCAWCGLAVLDGGLQPQTRYLPKPRYVPKPPKSLIPRKTRFGVYAQVLLIDFVYRSIHAGVLCAVSSDTLVLSQVTLSSISRCEDQMQKVM